MNQFLDRHGTRITAWVFVLVPSLFIASMLTPGLWFAVAFWLAYLFGVAVLLLLAWIGWVRHLRPTMPSWRNGLCLAAFAITCLNWAYLAASIGTAYAALIFGSHSGWIASYPIDHFFLIKSHFVAIVLASALKRTPRVQAIGASIMFLVSVGSVAT